MTSVLLLHSEKYSIVTVHSRQAEAAEGGWMSYCTVPRADNPGSSLNNECEDEEIVRC